MNLALKIERARKARGLGPMLPADWSAHFQARSPAATMRPVVFDRGFTFHGRRLARERFDVASVLP